MAAREQGAKAAAAAVSQLMAGLSRAERTGAASALAWLGLAVLCEIEGREFVRGFLASAHEDYSHGVSTAAVPPARRM